jgi:hypothetical protein
MTRESDIRERETTNPGRAANGRFQPGNPGGPGNPLGGRIAAARGTLRDRITEDDLTAIWDRVIAMAKDGHWQAIKLVLSYVAGKPGKMPDLQDFAAPSPNGVFSAPPPKIPVAAPSPNGVFSAPPSPNGVFGEVPAAAPSPNGVFSAPPSPNGVFSAPPPRIPVAAPSPNGVFSAPPSPNGVFSAPPSPNGVFGEAPAAVNGSHDAAPAPAPRIPVAAPSPNGVFSVPPRNRKERRAQQKAQRIAERQAHRAPGASA